MSYRDDRDADHARIASLESELAQAKAKVDELEGQIEGRGSTALAVAGATSLAPGGRPGAAQRWLGAPLRLGMTRRFDGAYPTDKLEDLLEVIRTVTADRGRTEVLRSSLTWWASANYRGSGPATCLVVAVKDGATTLTVTDRLGPLAGGLYGGLGGGLGGGGMAPPLFASMTVPVLAPVFMLGWFGAVYAGTRALFKRQARKRAETVCRLFDTLEREIAATLRR